jgi:hypothetical protein
MIWVFNLTKLTILKRLLHLPLECSSIPLTSADGVQFQYSVIASWRSIDPYRRPASREPCKTCVANGKRTCLYRCPISRVVVGLPRISAKTYASRKKLLLNCVMLPRFNMIPLKHISIVCPASAPLHAPTGVSNLLMRCHGMRRLA